MMQIIANIFTALGHIIDAVAGFKFNEKDKIMLSCILSSTCSLVAMILLKSTAGAVSVLVTLTRLSFIYFKDKYNWKVDFVSIIFIGMYAMVFFDKNIVVATLMFAGNMCSFLPKWFCKDVQQIRIGAMGANVFSIIYSSMIGNYASIPFNVANIVLISLAFLKWNRATINAQSKQIPQ